MRKAFRFLDHFHKEHESFDINSLHMRRFVKITRRMIHAFELYTRDLNAALKETVKRKKRANLRDYRTSTFELIEAKECRSIYTTKETKNKKVEKRKVQRELAKKKKEQEEKKQQEQQNKEIEKNDEDFESVEIVVVEALNINLNNNDVEKMKYISLYAPVVEASETSVQHSKIEEKKSENEKKKYLLDEDVVRFNAFIATANYDDA